MDSLVAKRGSANFRTNSLNSATNGIVCKKLLEETTYLSKFRHDENHFPG